MLTYIQSGGPVMVPIIACSIIALATWLERTWALRRSRLLPEPFCIEVFELVKQRRFDDALTLCRKDQRPISRLFEAALVMREAGREEMRDRMEEVGRREAAEMERFTPILGTIASLGPLLGLLGTVGGMIITFESIKDQGLGDVARLAGGIGQALITTFSGLVVAIPALIAHRWLLARIDRTVLDLEEVSGNLVALLHEQQKDLT